MTTFASINRKRMSATPPRATVLATAVLVVSALLGLCGCTAPQATINVLAAAEEAVQSNLHADDQLSAALAKQSQDQQAALNQAFLSDLRGLATQNGGKVAIADIEQGKALYDQQLAAILTSRDAVSKLFSNKQRTQQAALDLIEKARQLSTGEIQVRSELQKVEQETLQLLHVSFPSTIPATGAAGANGGNKP